MYSKATCRALLVSYKRYIKLGVFADEFGLARNSLSLFMKNDSFDYIISEDRINSFISFVSSKIENLT